MRLIHRERVQEFIKLHPDSGSSLKAWVQNMELNNFDSPVVLKKTFGSADYVRPCWVFNIAGNKFRLIALVDFEGGFVSVEGIMTHAEYDKGKWRKAL